MERSELHPCLHAGSSPPPSLWGLGSPQIAPGGGPFGCSISSVSIRGGCESTSLGIPLAWVVQGALKERQWDLQWGWHGWGDDGAPCRASGAQCRDGPKGAPAPTGLPRCHGAQSSAKHGRTQQGTAWQQELLTFKTNASENGLKPRLGTGQRFLKGLGGTGRPQDPACAGGTGPSPGTHSSACTRLQGESKEQHKYSTEPAFSNQIH